MLKRVYMGNLKARTTSFVNPTTGEYITDDGIKLQLPVSKKTGLTPLPTILDVCKSQRLYIVGKLTDTMHEWYNVESTSNWVSEGIFSERSYTMSQGSKHIELRATCKSYFPSCTDVTEAYEAYQELSTLYYRHTHLVLLGSPSSSGLSLLEATFPKKLQLEVLDEKYSTYIREFTTQPRMELFVQDTDIITDFYYSDGKWMYASCVDKDMPIGKPVFDTIPVYEKYVPGWYRITAIVPENWQHVGLIPQCVGKGKDKQWVWPNQPNTKITTVVCEPELRVAIENGWSIKILERLLFPKDRPFRNWHKALIAMWEDADNIENENIRKQVKAGIRQIMLNSIGRLYMQEWKREKKIPLQEYAKLAKELPVSSRLNAKRVGNFMVVPVVETMTEKDKKFYHPELPAYVWSYCRRALTQQMLKLPYNTILGCRLDAIYTTSKPAIVSTGKIGEFRLKGELHGSFPTPTTYDDLKALAVLSEQQK